MASYALGIEMRDRVQVYSIALYCSASALYFFIVILLYTAFMAIVDLVSYSQLLSC